MMNTPVEGRDPGFGCSTVGECPPRKAFAAPFGVRIGVGIAATCWFPFSRWPLSTPHGAVKANAVRVLPCGAGKGNKAFGRRCVRGPFVILTGRSVRTGGRSR